MNYPDFSSIFPTPNTNYPCTFNPNSGYASDCVGEIQISSSSSSSNPVSTGPQCMSGGGKTICIHGNLQCTYDPKTSPPLICKDKYCSYGYNNGELINSTSFKPPLISVPDTKTCTNEQPPAGYYDPKNAPPPAQPVGLPKVSNSFTLHKWALPITIPSKLTTDETVSGKKSPDPSVLQYWIQAPYVPEKPYSDLFPDPDPTHKGKPFVWDGFHKALSKCIELDGSTYPASTNVCKGNSTDAKNCIDPLLAAPNKRPKCYAVTTQSNYIGSELKDRSYQNLNYFLVEEPNSSPRTNLKEFNNIFSGEEWVKDNEIDKNFLFCQTQFYTWIKNKSSNDPYNQSPTPDFSVSSCPGPVYSSHNLGPKDKGDPNFFNLPPSFYENNPNWEEDLKQLKSEKKYKPPEQKSYTTYIIIGVVAVIGIAAWYYTMGPGSESEDIIPVKPVKLPKIGIKKGGYYYYDDI